MNSVSLFLDLLLIGLLGAGIFYAVRLSKQMAGLHTSRAEMESFVHDFNVTVQRAESGIYGLKQAARTGGDDLEQLIEKAQVLRDELRFLVESADQIAARLSDTAAAATRLTTPKSETSQDVSRGVREKDIDVGPESRAASHENRAQNPASAAERELLKVLGKLG